MVLQDRIVNLPVKAGNYSDLGLGQPVRYFILSDLQIPSETSKLHKYNLKDRKDEEVMELDNYMFLPTGKKCFISKGQFLE